MLSNETTVESFTRFVEGTERRLRRALSASLGTEAGREAAAEALAYGWEHWDRVHQMDNPAGYLYTVGRDRGRRKAFRSRPMLMQVDEARLPWIEPGLPSALQRLPEQQRVAVMLHHCFGLSLSEAAELVGVTKATMQTHARRGLSRLRKELGVIV